MNETALQDKRIGNELARVKKKIEACYRDKADRTGMMTDMGVREVKPGKGKDLFDLKRRRQELERASDALRLVR